MSRAAIYRKKDGTYVHTYSKNVEHNLIEEGAEKVVVVHGWNMSFGYPEE